MNNRFCSNCGAKLLPDSRFCVECGAPQGGGLAARPLASFPLQRYAPLLVLVVVVAVAGGVIAVGSLNPKSAPSVPRHESAQSSDVSSGSLPKGHPPIAVPEEVKQGIRDMEKKADAAPDDIDAWKRLAEVQYRAGQVDPSYLPQAEASYRHVLERRPDDLEILRSLGNIAFDQDHHEDAVAFYQKYLKLKPDDADVQTDLGTMYLSAGQSEQAIQQYQTVLKQDPTFFQAQFNLAIAYRSAGQMDKVIPALEKARGMAKDDQTRNQVDQVMARVKGMPPAAGGARGAPAAGAKQNAAGPAAPAADTFQGGMETYFRQHPILGPKVERIEWSGPESAKVYLRDFPMDQMPPDMMGMFGEKVKSAVKEQKDAHKVTGTARFELVDSASSKVMDTIEE